MERKMKKFCQVAEATSSVLNALKIKTASLVLTSAVIFATSMGIMNPTEVKAQTTPALEAIPHYVIIGRNDPTNSWNDNTFLSFGRGVPTSGWNSGLWAIGSIANGLSIGRVWNTTIAAPLQTIFITSNGNVGIRNTNPQYSLDVSGTIRSSNGICNSDRRYKRNIKPLANLDNLFKINSVQYNSSDEALKEQLELFKQENKDKIEADFFGSIVSDFEQKIAEQNADQRIYFGIIAQELQKIYPDLVYEDDQGYLAVNYTGLIPVMLDAIKEQQKTLENQQQQINELRNRDKNFEKTSTTNAISGAKLYQNNPNPFDKSTEIKCFIPSDANIVFICVYVF
jgi:hypothetical protein